MVNLPNSNNLVVSLADKTWHHATMVVILFAIMDYKLVENRSGTM